MLQARYRPRLRRMAIASAVALVAAISAMSVGASESQATFSVSGGLGGGCISYESFCANDTDGGGGSWGGDGGSPDGGSPDGGSPDGGSPDGGTSPDGGSDGGCTEDVGDDRYPVPCDPIDDGLPEPEDEFPKGP
jgi:hypothetical protein